MKRHAGIMLLWLSIVVLIPLSSEAYSPLEACYNACDAIWRMDNEHCRRLKTAREKAICWAQSNEDRSNCRRACEREAMQGKCR